MKAAVSLCSLACASLLAAAVPSVVHAQAFLPGEILVNEFFGDNVQLYSATGTLLQTYSTTTQTEGASLTPDGNLVTDTETPDVTVTTFTPGGTRTGFTATGNEFAGDVSVFANGTRAVSNQFASTVQFFSPTGTLLNTVNLGTDHPFGNTVDSNDNLYVADLTNDNVDVINSSGTLTSRIHLSFTPSDLVMNPTDGTLWVAGRSNETVTHLTTAGTVLGSFATGFTGAGSGIALSTDGLSLYVDNESGSTLKHFDLSGNLLNSIALTSPSTPLFITVVPVAGGTGIPSSPLPATPEPGTWAMLGLGSALLLAVRRFRRA